MTQEEAQQMFEEETTKFKGTRTLTFSDWLNIKNVSIQEGKLSADFNYFNQ